MPGNWCAFSSQQPLMDFGYSTWFSVTMTIRKHGKTLHLLLMMAIFLYALGKSVSKWRDKKVGVTYGTKSADKMFYPSVTLVPLFEPSFSISRLSNLSSFERKKNLMELYNLKSNHIANDIISIEQNYELANG